MQALGRASYGLRTRKSILPHHIRIEIIAVKKKKKTNIKNFSEPYALAIMKEAATRVGTWTQKTEVTAPHI